MTAELSPDDLAAMRAKHKQRRLEGVIRPFCTVCDDWWPCDVVRLLDEVERLRRIECVHLWTLEMNETETWIRCVNCGARAAPSAPTADSANDSAVH